MEALVVVVVLAGVGMALRVLTSRDERQRLRRIGEACGLTALPDSPGPFDRVFRGSAGGLEVAVEHVSRSQGGGVVTVRVDHAARRIRGLSLRPESVGTALEKRLGVREIDTGDTLFDADFFVGGPVPEARALLDVATRNDLRCRLLPLARVEVADGVLHAELPAWPDWQGPLSQLLPALLDLARRLTREGSLASRLAENVTNDPHPVVRLRNLQLLVREFWGPAVRPAVLAACADSDPEVRLRAAAAVGVEGLPVLLQLAQDGELDDRLRAEAVATLGPRLTAAQASAILQQTSRVLHPATAEACIHVLGGHGAVAIDVLQEALAIGPDSLAAAAARALGATGDPRAEAALLGTLGWNGSEARREAATALGRLGSVAAVLPLKQAAERGAQDRPFARAAREAVAQIQARLPGAAAGQLSLAGVEAGQLTLADSQGGQLSLASSVGQVSLAAPDAAGKTREG